LDAKWIENMKRNYVSQVRFIKMLILTQITLGNCAINVKPACTRTGSVKVTSLLFFCNIIIIIIIRMVSTVV